MVIFLAVAFILAPPTSSFAGQREYDQCVQRECGENATGGHRTPADIKLFRSRCPMTKCGQYLDAGDGGKTGGKKKKDSLFDD